MITRRRILWSLGGLLVCWVAAVALTAFAAYQHDRDGLTRLDVLRHTSTSSLTDRATREGLLASQRSFDAADSDLNRPWMRPLTFVPVVDHQYDVARALSGGASRVASAGAEFLSAVHGILDAPHPAGQVRVEDLRVLSSAADTMDRRIAHVGAGPSGGLLGVVAAKRSEFVDQLASARSQLQRAARASAASAAILEGPSTYLVLAANNAEMRAGMGAPLEVGVATMSGGVIHVSPMQPAGALTLPAGAVTPPAQLAANWGWLHPGQDWRNLGITPDLPTTASLAATMWQARTGQHVDGVLVVDVAALARLLSVTGPVDVGGVVLGADNALAYLLHDQYAGLTDSATAEAGRRDRLGALAVGVLDGLQSQSVDLRSLGEAVSQIALGGHLQVWSADPSVEAAWSGLHVAGGLGQDSLGVAVVNRGGNKLDPLLKVENTLGVRSLSGGAHRVDLAVRLSDMTPPGESQYVAGPYPGLPAAYGEYIGLVEVTLPAYASHRSVPSGTILDAPDGPTWSVVVPVSVTAGGSVTLHVGFDVPAGAPAARIAPSARLPASTWQAGGRTFTDAQAQTVGW